MILLGCIKGDVHKMNTAVECSFSQNKRMKKNSNRQEFGLCCLSSFTR